MSGRFGVYLGASLLTVLVYMSTSAGAQTVTRGPYLQVATPDSITIRWRTDVATDSRVEVGPSVTNLPTVVDDPASTTEHIVAVSGLASYTKYYYAIGTTGGRLAGPGGSYMFRTSPRPGAVRDTRIWVIGDSGTADANARAVRDAYKNYTAGRRADVWLMLGDNAYDIGTDAEYQKAVFDTYPLILRYTPLWPTRGNHDGIHVAGDYIDFFSLPMAGEAGGVPSGTEEYYSFDYANIHFICLNSQNVSRAVDGPMMTWLATDLMNTTQEWIIAYFHHPPYSKGSHNSDNDLDSSGRLKDMREIALPILEGGGVDLVMTGHSHSYERSMFIDGHYDYSWTFTQDMIVTEGDGDPNGDGAYEKPGGEPQPNAGAVHVVAGSSGKLGGGTLDHPVMLVSFNTLGSMVIDINGRTLTAVFIDTKAAVLDTFTIRKSGVPSASGRPDSSPFRGACTATPAADGLSGAFLLLVVSGALRAVVSGRGSRRCRKRIG